MLALDRDAFLCDMAETYRIYDIKSIPLSMLSIYASGLGMNSRVRLKREFGLKAPWDIVLLAKIVDLLADDPKNAIAPIFIVKEKNRSEFRAFDSIEEFEHAKAEILEGSNTEEEVSYGGN